MGSGCPICQSRRKPPVQACVESFFTVTRFLRLFPLVESKTQNQSMSSLTQQASNNHLNSFEQNFVKTQIFTSPQKNQIIISLPRTTTSCKKIDNLLCQMKNDTQIKAYKPIFKIQTVCSSLIGQRSKSLAKKSIFLQLKQHHTFYQTNSFC